MKKPKHFALYAGLAAILGLGLAILFFAVPRWLITPPEEVQTGAASSADARKIRARLFYVTEAGNTLSSSEQEVTYGEGTVEQAKRIIEAQLSAPPAAHVSAIPTGTQLRTVFLSGGDAYIDLSAEVQKNHPGGTTNEILTVYTLVNALTSNLPAINGVQILVEGKEVETLAGHLDLRRPIEHDPHLIVD